jgi:hypothetical protein
MEPSNPMAILSLKNGPIPGAELLLKPGPNRIGRAEGNDHIIPDLSVSSVHCEATLDGRNLILRDLGSTNGTFVKSQRVREALLGPGESFSLGEVEIIFDAGSLNAEHPSLAAPAEAPVQMPLSPPRPVPISIPQPVVRLNAQVPRAPGPPLAGVATAPMAPTSGLCFQHLDVPAKHTCGKCGKDLCDLCVKLEKIGSKHFPFCRSCGGKCVPYGQQVTKPKTSGPVTFFQVLPSAFSYPFKGNGLIILLCGTVFFGFLDLITSGRAAMLMLASILVVRVITYGYLFAYMQKIICASAQGEDDPPGFPEVTDMLSDVIQPFFLLAMTVAVSFGPAIIAFYNGGAIAGDFLLVIGMLYFPMALLGVAMADSLSALNPVIVTSAILKVPKPYIVATLVFGGLLVVKTIIPMVFEKLEIPLIPHFLISFASLLLVTIEMRILGILYFTNRQKFDWFGESEGRR